jgi:hypothetical protein
MGYTASFVRGSRTLTIDGLTTYFLGQEFTPPGIRAEYSTGGGTSANRSGGMEKFGTKYDNREWNFAIQVRGTNEAGIVQAVRQLVSIIEDESEEPLYFYYKGNTLPEPSWGQFGASLKYTVVSGQCQVAPGYMVGDVRSSQVTVLLALNIKPYAEGKRVHIGPAYGGVGMYAPGSPHEANGGVVVGYAGTCVLADPTGYTNFTASGNAGIAKIHKNDCVVYGMPNATRYKTAGVGTILCTFTTQAASYRYVGICKASESKSPLWIPTYNGTTLTIGTVDLGNGFYKLTSNPITAPSGAGTIKFANTSSTVGYDQIMSYQGVLSSSTNYSSSPFHGDFIGGSWNGARYNSTSIMTYGYCFVPRDNDQLTGAVAVVHRSGTMPTNLFMGHPSLLNDYLALRQTNGTLMIFHGVGTSRVALADPADGETRRYIVSYNQGTSVAYVNGTAIGTAIGFLDNFPSSFELSEGGDGDTRGFTLYDTELSGAQVTALDAALSAAASQSGPIDIPPFFWTKDGDGILKNALDTVGGTINNYGVLAGIPGNHWAKAELSISQGVQIANTYSLNHSPFFTPPKYFVDDESGAAMGSASGGSIGQFSVGTAHTLIGSVNISDPTMIRDYVMGRDWYALTRLAGSAAAGTLYGYVRVEISGQAYIGSAFPTTIPHGTAYASWRVAPVNVPRMNYAYDNPFDPIYSCNMLLYVYNTGTAGILVDYTQFLPSPMTVIVGGAADTAAIIRDNDGMTGTASTGVTHIHYAPTFDGRRTLDVRPNEYNNFVWHVGENGSADNVTTAGTLDWYITPRWGIL